MSEPSGLEAPLPGEPQPVDNSTTGRSTAAAADDYAESLDRVGTYLAKCADPDDDGDGVTFCSRHPVYVRDLWRLYCERRKP